jgi:transcriptional regulator
MYIPPAFRESRVEVLHDLIRRHSFGILTSHVSGEPFATHLPFLLVLDAEAGPNGTLRSHMARANPHWQGFLEDPDADVLVIFQGPHAYVSPQWYTTPVAVPTWNYAAVHAYGRPRLIEDRDALRRLVADTVDTYEADGAYGPDGAAWSLERLDAAYVDALIDNIVGFEVPISRLEGKLKFSQNRSAADRSGVIDGLLRRGDPDGAGVAKAMQGLERERDRGALPT